MRISWQCSKCAKIANCDNRPSPQYGGKCPCTATGNHMWKKIVS